MADRKCTSWRGHKFEGRYNRIQHDTGWRSGGIFGDLETLYFLHNRERQLMFRNESIYIHDICVRCGEIIQRLTILEKSDGQ